MVWAGISWKGKTQIVVFNRTLNAEDYIHLLEDYYLPFTDKVYGGNAIPQQDNAPAHSAKHTHDFLATEGIIDMAWLPIKSAWGELSRRLYADARQFDSVEDIREALYYEWVNLELDYIRKLIFSMPDRVEGCRTNRGRATKY